MPKNNKLKKNNLIRLIEYFSIIIIVVLTVINLSNLSKDKEVLGASIDNVDLTNEKITYLNTVTDNSPLYFDAYIELAKLNIEKLNTNEAIKCLEIAEKINPNSQIVKSFRETLNTIN